MQPGNDVYQQIAAALIGLVKQVKALRYYPPGHPALRAAAQESLKGFQPLLRQTSHLSLAVRKEEFLFDNHPVAKTQLILGQLATFCFARRIQHLVFLADLSTADLHRFVSNMVLTPQEIHSRGGIQDLLERARVTTIWVNETDLDTILQRRRQIEALPPETEETLATQTDRTKLTPAQIQAANLERLLKILEQERDDQRFRHQLQELIPLLRLNLIPENRQLVLRAMNLLCHNATSRKFSDARHAYAMNALGQLVTNETIDFLVAFQLDSANEPNVRKALTQILVFLNDKVARRLMTLLAAESVAVNRRIIADTLVQIGAPAAPVLQEHLFDERWYVVRNAVAILGDIRHQDALLHLTPLLDHQDIRVRRETIRALTKIGGQRAVNILLQAAESADQELRRQALLSLGAIRAASAIPTLLNLLEQSDWSRRAVDIKKDTIRALGEIRSPDAVLPLAALLERRRFFRRALNDELRIAAATALGEIGEERARAALEKAVADRTPAVARAAAQALMQLEKNLP